MLLINSVDCHEKHGKQGLFLSEQLQLLFTQISLQAKH